MLNYQPTPDTKKRKNKDKDEESVIAAQDLEENCNLLVSDDYPPDIRSKVAMISEKDVDFEIIEVLFKSELTIVVITIVNIILVLGIINTH